MKYLNIIPLLFALSSIPSLALQYSNGDPNRNYKGSINLTNNKSHWDKRFWEKTDPKNWGSGPDLSNTYSLVKSQADIMGKREVTTQYHAVKDKRGPLKSVTVYQEYKGNPAAGVMQNAFSASTDGIFSCKKSTKIRSLKSCHVLTKNDCYVLSQYENKAAPSEREDCNLIVNQLNRLITYSKSKDFKSALYKSYRNINLHHKKCGQLTKQLQLNKTVQAKVNRLKPLINDFFETYETFAGTIMSSPNLYQASKMCENFYSMNPTLNPYKGGQRYTIKSTVLPGGVRHNIPVQDAKKRSIRN